MRSKSSWTLARAYQDAGRWEQAQHQYQRAQALHPGSVPALLGLGSLCYQTGRYRDAARHYQRAAQAASSDLDWARAYDGLVWVYRQLGDRRLADEAAARQAKYEIASFTDGGARPSQRLRYYFEAGRALDRAARKKQ